MHKLYRAAAVLAAVALSVPVGAATWSSYGSAEPDTVLDDPTLMWTDAPPAGAKRVYFNAYAIEATTGLNPNAAAADTHIELVGNEYHYAILGVWTDCNGDGYVGMAETAVREYKSELLLDSSKCAPKNGGACWVTGISPCPNWPATGYNNYNGWVTELIPIGGIGTTQGDRRVIKDNDAMVWGDYGRPKDPAGVTAATCTILFPRGYAQSTGGILSYSDCQTGALNQWNNLWETPAGDPANLRFADENDARGSWADAAPHPVFGSEHSDNAIVTTGDCSQTPIANTGTTPPGADNDNKNVYPPSTQVNPNGNLAGTFNRTFESAPLADTQTDTTPNGRTHNCDYSDDRGADFYGNVEVDSQGEGQIGYKTESTWTFQFDTMTRGGAPLLGLGNTGAGGGPSDAGLEPIHGACLVCQQSEWVQNVGGTLKVTPQTTRGNVSGTVDGSNPIDIDQGYWKTFYAHVGGATAASGAITPGGSGTYGADQCGTQIDGNKNGWNCAKSAWYRNPDGSTYPEGVVVGYFYARPGQAYELRDADCMDGSVLDGSAGVQPAYYGTDSCATG